MIVSFFLIIFLNFFLLVNVSSIYRLLKFEYYKPTYMKKLFIILSVIGISFSSCKKEEEPPHCERNNYGTIEVHNLRDYTYDFVVDTTYICKIGPNETKSVIKHPGHHSVKLHTNLGYYYIRTVHVSQCEVVELTLDYN